MHYRVVMQGRTLGGADVNEVKRNFMRVTGLPVSVAEDLFAGMPKVVRRQVPQSDAERIAATLRAIGAAATVEREAAGSEEKTSVGIEIIASALSSGPPTVIPGMEPAPANGAPPPSRLSRGLRRIAEHWQAIAGSAALVAGLVVFGPAIMDLVARMRPKPAPPVPAAAASAPHAASADVVAPLNVSLMHGPWRCTDQRTGSATYWSYNADGSLVFHGDVLRDKPAPPSPDGPAPTGWKIEGRRLVMITPNAAPVSYAIDNLTLTRLRYTDNRLLEVECRRP